jgi:hypothetical protein
MRVVSHGLKLLKTLTTIIVTPYMQQVLQTSGLANLLQCCYKEVERGLIAAFIERWHYETSTFHLPVGEMTVTLDDVAAITKLPVDGMFYTFFRATKEDA